MSVIIDQFLNIIIDIFDTISWSHNPNYSDFQYIAILFLRDMW